MNAEPSSFSSAASLPPTRRFTDTGDVAGIEPLLRAVQELSLARSVPDIQRIVHTAARELTRCDGATVVLREGDQCHYADDDAIAPLWKGSRFPIDACISGWSMLNREVAVIPDIYSDPRIPHAAYRPTFVKSLVMVPIRTLDPIGAIGIYWAQRHQPTEQEVPLLRALADSTSVAMENVTVYSELEQRVRERTAALEKANEEIRQLSITDELTGLTNRRGFYLLADRALRAARQHGRSCLLAFLDVDALKRVNDEYGHHTGDRLILDFARVLRAALRESDIIARMGGDEFCVLVTEHEGNPAMLRERIAPALKTFNDRSDGPYRLSASIGVVQASATDFTTVDELLARADELMYAEKTARLGWRLGADPIGPDHRPVFRRFL